MCCTGGQEGESGVSSPDPVAADAGVGAIPVEATAVVGAAAAAVFPGHPDVEVFVSLTCPTCATSQELAREVQRLRPDRKIHLTWVDDQGPGAGRADRADVVGTPTYRVHGTLAFLGNPSLSELLAAIDKDGLPA